MKGFIIVVVLIHLICDVKSQTVESIKRDLGMKRSQFDKEIIRTKTKIYRLRKRNVSYDSSIQDKVTAFLADVERYSRISNKYGNILYKIGKGQFSHLKTVDIRIKCVDVMGNILPIVMVANHLKYIDKSNSIVYTNMKSKKVDFNDFNQVEPNSVGYLYCEGYESKAVVFGNESSDYVKVLAPKVYSKDDEKEIFNFIKQTNSKDVIRRYLKVYLNGYYREKVLKMCSEFN